VAAGHRPRARPGGGGTDRTPGWGRGGLRGGAGWGLSHRGRERESVGEIEKRKRERERRESEREIGW